jgi:uncharacterized protein YxeA
MLSESFQKVAQLFRCEKCDYETCRKTNYEKHAMTAKHIKTTNATQNTTESSKKVADLFWCDCGNSYKHHSSLWKHRKTCNKKYKKEEKEVLAETPTSDASNNTFVPCEFIMEMFKEMLKNQNEQMIELISKGIGNNSHNTTNNNSHNTTNKNRFNINLFLNEQCKDAMNIMDFVNTMQLQLSDLERVGELGYVKGISNIVVNKLKDLDIHKRPIHCSDLKRETMYVKDENVWEKENEKKEKLSKMITNVAHKNQKQINEWQKENPEYKDSESIQSEKYLKIVCESMSGLTNDDESCGYTNKIIKNIAKEVIIEKEE